MSKPKTEHSTLEAYIVGFVLSLIFTFIPYYLVVSKTVTGTTLLLTILGFGLLQMLVQVFFFLHLGRGPKPFYNVVFFGATVGAILVVVGGSVVIIDNLHYNMAPADQVKKLVNDEGIYQVGGKATGACQGQHDNHQVIIQSDNVTPVYTYAKTCDTLTFVNRDNEQREIAFGPHPIHKTYAGETIFDLRKGKNETITLSESGTYKFHDHLHSQTAGYFTVEP
jgi:cytochrome o ubiquinol oxidase subunit IV